MFKNSQSERSSEKRTFFRGGGSKPRSHQGPRNNNNRSNGGRSARPIKKFNPSDFIKKVKDLVAAPVYTPQHMFADFDIEPIIKKNIARKGYTAPTPIQDQAIPVLLEGKDIIGTANTGTGKTAAFLIPLLNDVLTRKTNKVLIITPTRELAAQIQTELDSFKAGTLVTSALCIGGLHIHQQIHALRRNPAFVIGTPGRLKDLEQNKYLNLSQYTSIVLDEVDTMFDMGFINDIKYLISKLPQERHSLFFSATMNPAIKEVMSCFLRNPISIDVKTRQTTENVNQDVVKTTPTNKIDVLHDLLINPEFTKVIVFMRTQRGTEKLSKALQERGFEVATIHGDKTQGQRQRSLGLFRDNRIKILLATDVVARGIDIKDISHVINFELPQTYEDYVHRIGRTGRANKIGQALTFIE